MADDPKKLPNNKILLLPSRSANIGNTNPPNIYPTKNRAAINDLGVCWPHFMNSSEIELITLGNEEHEWLCS